MSGMLDNKSRIMDVILTQEGKRQLASGDMRIEHLSFTDGGTFYLPDATSGSLTTTHRIFLEATSLPQDKIAFEADDSGNLKPINNDQLVKNGNILVYGIEQVTGSITSSLESVSVLSGDDFSSAVTTLLLSSTENINKLQILSTFDRVFDDEGFGINADTIKFVITDRRPTPDASIHVDKIKSLFFDQRLSHVSNFKYLPPTSSGKKMGSYSQMGLKQSLSYSQLKNELNSYERFGFCKTIHIDPTSKENNLFCQFFEKRKNQLAKLDVLDYGKHKTNDPNHPIAHVFFVGKVILNEQNAHCFMHIFTLVFD